jgi:hypothetical protein
MSPNQIEERVESAFPSDEKLARQANLDFCHRYSGRKLQEIGSRFGMELSGVTQVCKRICLKAEKDRETHHFVNYVGLTPMLQISWVKGKNEEEPPTMRRN